MQHDCAFLQHQKKCHFRCFPGRQGCRDPLGPLDPQLDRRNPGSVPALRAAGPAVGGRGLGRGPDPQRRDKEGPEFMVGYCHLLLICAPIFVRMTYCYDIFYYHYMMKYDKPPIDGRGVYSGYFKNCSFPLLKS